MDDYTLDIQIQPNQYFEIYSDKNKRILNIFFNEEGSPHVGGANVKRRRRRRGRKRRGRNKPREVEVPQLRSVEALKSVKAKLDNERPRRVDPSSSARSSVAASLPTTPVNKGGPKTSLLMERSLVWRNRTASPSSVVPSRSLPTLCPGPGCASGDRVSPNAIQSRNEMSGSWKRVDTEVVDSAEERKKSPTFTTAFIRAQCLQQIARSKYNPEIKYLMSNEHFVVATFIFECGRKLDAEVRTIATACTCYHRFFKAASAEDYDPYLIATVSLYLAGKTEDNYLKIRDVINVTYHTLYPDSEPLMLGEHYWGIRDSIVQGELLVLRMLKFQAKFDHPHKYMLLFLRSLKNWFDVELWEKFPIASSSWSFLQDFYLDSSILDHNPHHTALACINLSFETYGLTVPGFDRLTKPLWHQMFDETATHEKVWKIMIYIMEVYNKELELLMPLVAPNKE